jgi:hypothetical protein
MNNFKKIIEIFLLLKEIWKDKKSLLLISVLLLVSYLYSIRSYISLSGSTLNDIIPSIIPIRNIFFIFIIIEIVVIIVWLYSRSIPRISSKNIGIVLAIKTNNRLIENKIKTDFIDAIYKNLSDHGNFKIISLSEYHTSKILNDNNLLKKYHYKTNCNLIIYGLSDSRTHESKKCYYLQLDTSIYHSPITPEKRNFLGREMRAVVPRENLIPHDNEYLGFKFSTQLFSIASRYILGLGAFFSNCYEIAFQLHNNTYHEISSMPSDTMEFPILKRILNKSKTLILDESNIISNYSYFENNYPKMKYYIDVMKNIDQTFYSGYLINAIYLFKCEHNADAALEEIIKASKNTRDYTWAYSKAFLLAYKGDMDGAYENYKIAFTHNASDNAYMDSELFMYQVLEDEPYKYQLLYCIGLINYKMKQDTKLAKENFEQFVKKSIEKNEYHSQREYSLKYILKC